MKLIIIDGTAHSGTTILAYCLRQHPDINVYTGGPEQKLLENDWLRYKKLEPILKIVAEDPKYVLLKRPWTIKYNSQWLLENFLTAKFIYCTRNENDTIISWRSSGSMLSPEMKDLSKKAMQAMYHECNIIASAFSKQVPFFRYFDHATLSQETLNELVAWLELPEFKFTIPTTNVKKLLRQEK